QGAARKGAGERYRSALGAGRPRERAAERIGASGTGDPRHRLLSAAIRKRRAVRSGAGEYSRQSIAAIGNTDGAASGAIGAGHSVGPADAPGARRHRCLSRPWAGAGAASAYRRLEQPVTAQGELK